MVLGKLAEKPKQGRGKENRTIRLILAKCGLDGHDRGIKVVAKALKDAGIEVIYLGLRQTPESVVTAALQEDVDGIGISSLAGAHDYIFPRILEMLREKKAEDIRLFGGGVFPKKDLALLESLGVMIFKPGTHLNMIVEWVRKELS